jgi:hypothetical protein
MSPLARFLSSLGLDAYIGAFEAAGVTLEELPRLSPQELNTDLGMSFGDRKKLIAALSGAAPGGMAVPPAAPVASPSASAAGWGAPLAAPAVSSPAASGWGAPPAPAAPSPAGWGAAPVAPAAPAASGGAAAWGVGPSAWGAPSPSPAASPFASAQWAGAAAPAAAPAPAAAAFASAQWVPGAPAPANPALALLSVGQSVAGFTITAELGRGAFGQVYRARADFGDEEVALKVVPLYDRAKEAARAFVSEWSAVRGIQHPHLLESERPQPATSHGLDVLLLPLQLADGGSFRGWLEAAHPLRTNTDAWAKRLSEGLVAMGHVASGLAALHAAGRVHLDVKPENVLRVREAWKVADFGFARDVDTVRRAGGQGLPESVGTPIYMSPEQFLSARPQDVGPEADVWSLGVMLFELFDGHPPVQGDVHRLRALITSPNLRIHWKGLPAAWQPLVQRCLAHDPAARPTAEEVAAALGGTSAAQAKITQPKAVERAAAAEDERAAAFVAQARREREAAEAKAANEREAAEAKAKKEREAAEAKARKAAAAAAEKARKAEAARAAEEQVEIDIDAAKEAAAAKARPKRERDAAKARREREQAFKDVLDEEELEGGVLGDDQFWVLCDAGWPWMAMTWAYDAGCIVTSASYSAADSAWVLIFTEHAAGQSYEHYADHEEALAEIEAYANRLLVPGDDEWLALGTSDEFLPRVSGTFTRCEVVTQASFPKSTVEKLWAEGFRVTSCHSSGNRWSIGARKPKKPWKQQFVTGSYSHVKDFCVERWGENETIVAFGYGAKTHWAIVEASAPNVGMWGHASREALPEKLRTFAADGSKRITTVHADNDGWMIVAVARPPWAT